MRARSRPGLPLLVAVLLGAGLAGCLDGADPQPPADDGSAAADPVIAEVEKDIWAAFLPCGVGGAGSSANPCAGLPDSANVFPFTVKAGLKTVLLGLAYTPNPPGLADINLLLDTDDPDPVEGPSHRYHSSNGGPGHTVRIDNDDIVDGPYTWDNITGSLDLLLRIFPSSGGAVTVQQNVDIHVVLYYGVEAPEDADPFADVPAGGNATYAS